MLLPSALSCDSSQPRLQSALFTPPSSPPPQSSTQSAIGNLIASCRNLHNLLGSPTSSDNNPAAKCQLSSPPLDTMPNPISPRLRRREVKPTLSCLNQTELPRYRIKKRSPPRGANKRRRAADDDMGRTDDKDEACDDAEQQEDKVSTDMFGTTGEENKEDVFVFKGYTAPSPRAARAARAAPSTPKRQRIAPPDIPRGLTKEDFHKIGIADAEAEKETTSEGTNIEVGDRGESWSLEDDAKLVEVVLEKVKNIDLSKEVWEDCVRNLPGRDHGSVSSRWRSLINRDKIGLQKRGRRGRGKLHGTW